ncbi:NAD(P) transhydrogenase subunit alpha part 1 [Beijerinckiaceae bacterium RH AL1]|nr:Re/Si-specific NAD(P)(+) transhydrogenase subunit alpha [Beijerinckiaceae bacterium]VVB46601.1 NAD(P) transhydrogenase subunit alpha part 1 [Beijerinckiaceae bacterium RH CH11]VVB46686.1 NAD(P) transhydrogenase subunit alpha part 1 [Beijerinckiaceae bacterium RH AL8]VVC55457.1 NAD(P) transhydrogenase subunit alpha part 1 [Beijerinckiaceae bacterium RH AL1]
MRIAVPAENDKSEHRVAATPETVKRFKALNAEVAVQSGAGFGSGFLDDAYEAAGATIVHSAEEAIRDADVVLRVRRPSADDLNGLKGGAAVVGIMDPYGNVDALKSLAEKGASAFAMEFMPRITRAQVMDVLSSQANIAGYRAVIDAASEFGRAIPMMTTAAGTVAAAKMFIMGVGVAGLQAIAMARRLGGVVTATDVRPATKEQVESLGAKFVAVQNKEFKEAETAAGYAKEMSDDYKRQQAELVAEHIAKQDIVVCTALIPGKPAPRLVSAKMVESMKPGSVIVDLAAERGGNCELTKPGETFVTDNGVKIVGALNLAGAVPQTASQLYAKNLYAFVETFFDKESKAFSIPWDDELVKATLLTRDGKLVHPNFTEAA